MGYDIFVSYSTKDKLFVDALVNRLENEKFRCWYAPRDIPAGVAWPAAIAQAIKQTPVMLLVFSGSSNSSEEVSRELTLASNQKCLVIPVRIENVLPSIELEYHLTNRHWLDVYGLEVEAAVGRIVEGVAQYADSFLAAAGKLREETAGTPAGGGVGSPITSPKASGRGAVDAVPATSGKSFFTRRAILALLVFCALAGGLWSYTSKKSAMETLQAEGSAVLPAERATLQIYKDNTGVTAAILRLHSAASNEYLVRISGIPLSHAIFRCTLEDKGAGADQRFVTHIDGERYVLLTTGKNGATLFQPASTAEIALKQEKPSADAEDIVRVIREYLKQEK